MQIVIKKNCDERKKEKKKVKRGKKERWKDIRKIRNENRRQQKLDIKIFSYN